MVLEAPLRFIFSPALGFYVTVGIPYDIVYLDRSYYCCRFGAWYVAPTYRGSVDSGAAPDTSSRSSPVPLRADPPLS